MFCRFHEQLDMIDGSFEGRTKSSQTAVVKIERKEAKNCYPQTARRGNERLGYAAADFQWGELLLAHEIERPHDACDGSKQSQERRKSNERSKHPDLFFSLLDFGAGAQLHGAQQGGMRV